MGPNINIIVAVDKAGGIGAEGNLPWSLNKEWLHFLKLVTRKSDKDEFVCWIMGKKSWDLHTKPNGLFEKMEKEGHKILKIVMSRTCTEEKLDELTYVASNWNKVLHMVGLLDTKFKVAGYWNLGGPGVYKSQLESNRLIHTRLYLTLIEAEFQCDAFFPNLKIFGLTCVPTEYCVKSGEALELVDIHDEDVDVDSTEIENEIRWKYRVLQFVQK